jgi:hypothetical protein
MMKKNFMNIILLIFGILLLGALAYAATYHIDIVTTQSQDDYLSSKAATSGTTNEAEIGKILTHALDIEQANALRPQLQQAVINISSNPDKLRQALACIRAIK